jgi:rubrerythrin
MKETINNLMKAFIGESQARNRYTFFASTAKKEGYEQIAEIFLITADNEREHASWFYKMLIELMKKEGIKEDELTVQAQGPIIRKSTLENLKSAAKGNTMNMLILPKLCRRCRKRGIKRYSFKD